VGLFVRGVETEVIRRFVELASRKRLRGKVLAVPFANLPAVRERRPHLRMKPEQPYGDDRGHNMNRTWPGDRAGNDTGRVSHALYQAFGDEATHVFDLHCWEKHAAPAVLIRDTPELRELAAKLGHRFVHLSAPNNITVGGYFCSTGRIGVTYECSGQYVVVEKQVKRGLRLLTNFAKAIGMLGGALQKGDDPVLFFDRMATLDVTAPTTGLFVGRALPPCDPVEKGAVLGRLPSDVDLSSHEIRSPATGCLRTYGASRANCDVALPGHHPDVTEGDRLATVAWATQRGVSAVRLVGQLRQLGRSQTAALLEHS